MQDADLKRCFGLDKQIKDCDWSCLETLRTTKAPHEPLACLRDLLERFLRPEWKDVWLMLDIKVSSILLLRAVKKNGLVSRCLDLR